MGGVGKDLVTVRLVGGPADWAGRSLELPRENVYERPRDHVGAYLISTHTPKRSPEEDQDPRAVYEPDTDEAADPALWRFRGWFPGSPSAPDPDA